MSVVKSLHGLGYRSSKIPEESSYDSVAAEYYDEKLHPTCADFRSASRIYLEKLFDEVRPAGRFADIGCGRSLLTDFQSHNLVLIDNSNQMAGQNAPSFEKRLLNVEQECFGEGEFDWIFAVLGDPYNSLKTWQNIYRALKVGGQCVFILPSVCWARKFRSRENEERPNFARFVTSNGSTVFLRSLVVDPDQQREMIADAGLSLVAIEHVLVGDLPFVRSPKISEFLTADQELLDVYRAEKLS
jgi:SAM-dependent methyltransferase